MTTALADPSEDQILALPTYHWDAAAPGDEAPIFSYTVTREAIATYCKAVRNGNPLYLDEAAAKAGPFGLAQAISLDKLDELGQARALEHHMLPLRAGLDDIPALSLTPDQAGLLRQGQVLAGVAKEDGQYFACLEETPIALVEALSGQVRVVRGFNL